VKSRNSVRPSFATSHPVDKKHKLRTWASHISTVYGIFFTSNTLFLAKSNCDVLRSIHFHYVMHKLQWDNALCIQPRPPAIGQGVKRFSNPFLPFLSQQSLFLRQTNSFCPKWWLQWDMLCLCYSSSSVFFIYGIWQLTMTTDYPWLLLD